MAGGRARAALTGLCLAALASWPAQAQTYPSRQVTIVVPYAAGGGLDLLARTLAQRLTERLGKPFVVENRPGAGTAIGAASVAKAAPDGYTLMLATSSPLAINVTLHKNLQYDPVRDFSPIALASNAPFVLLVNPSFPVHSVAELVKLAKEKPGQLSFGSAGLGSPAHMSFELFKLLAGIDLVHVPYRGDSQSLNDLVAGHIPVIFCEPSPVYALLKEDKVRALAVSSTTRLPPLPNVPTMMEAGVPGYDFVSWQMMVAPAGAPKEIIDTLHTTIKSILALPEIKDEFNDTGRIAVDSPPPEQLKSFIASEIVRLGKVVESAGLAKSQ